MRKRLTLLGLYLLLGILMTLRWVFLVSLSKLRARKVVKAAEHSYHRAKMLQALERHPSSPGEGRTLGEIVNEMFEEMEPPQSSWTDSQFNDQIDSDPDFREWRMREDDEREDR
jgi:hypothetical protein